MILFQNQDFLIIEKPSGLMVHSDGKTNEKTLADFLIEHFPEIREVGEPWNMEADKEGKMKERIFRPGIVHRLDKDTSGVMIIALNQESFDIFKEKFKNREIKKEYVSLVYGNITKDEGFVDAPLSRSKKDFRQWTSHLRGSRGKERDAYTAYVVEIRFEKEGEKYCRVRLFPTTGRTHQLRVHMKYNNTPIVCDDLYAGKRVCPSWCSRMALHAQKISFEFKREKYVFDSLLPAVFKV